MYTIKKLTDAEFAQIADQHPDVYIPLDQSPVWRPFDEEMGNREMLGTFGYYDGGRIVATARVNLFRPPLRVSLVVNQGPIWFGECTPEAEAELVETMVHQFTVEQDSGALFMRMQLRHAHPQALPTYELFMFDKAMWVDIDMDEKALFKSFSSGARNLIKKAVKMGVEVREIPVEERIDLYWRDLQSIMDETTTRNDFRAHPGKIYTAIMKAFPEMAKLFVAYVDGEPCSWMLTVEYRGHAVYMFAAGNDVARRTNAAYLMQWEGMRDMQSRGNKVWDMTGVESENYPSLKNVTVFKKKFSRNIVELPVHYDIPFNKLRYQAVTKGLNARRAAMKQVGRLRRQAGTTITAVREKLGR